MSVAAVAGAKHVIARFTFRRVAVGAVIFGLFAAVESAAQGLGVVAAYPNMVERAKVVHALADNAALGLFYGNRHSDIVSPAGYMEYRVLPILTLVGAIWGLLFITKMLRGQEETGRWEILLAGQTTARKATAKTLRGAAGGLLMVLGIVTVLLLGAGQSDKFPLPAGGALLYGLVLASSVALAFGIGAFTSQLAATRRRAVLYGLAVLIPLFMLRSVGNVVDSLAWLKNLTPFGWLEKVQPFYHTQARWLLLVYGVVLVACGLAVWLAGRRDMAESFVADTVTAPSHTGLLNSMAGFHFRLMRGSLLGWFTVNVALAAIVAGIVKSVSQSLADGGTLTQTFSNLSGNPSAQFELAYLGATGYLTATILMVVMTAGLASLRDEEMSGRLDNIVSGTVSRIRWLGARLALMVVAAVGITLAVNLVVWALATSQGVDVSFGRLMGGGLNILGPVAFLLGVGVLLYGLVPRVATVVMYALIAWSFTIDIVASIIHASKYLADTSLLHHIALVPAAAPHWGACGVLTLAGAAMAGLGLLAFRRRDLQAE